MPMCPNCDSHDMYDCGDDERACGDCGYREENY